MEFSEERVIGMTDVGSAGVEVVTVRDEEDPTRFETSVFRRGTRNEPLDTVQHDSEQEAYVVHDRLVNEWFVGGSRCRDCGTPFMPRRKFNGGNPITVWLPECNCQDARNEAETDAFVERLNERMGPIGGGPDVPDLG